MDITIHASFLPHDDPDAAVAFSRDALGFEVRSVNLATADLDGTLARLHASGAEVVQVRDCAFRDPAGNLTRINEPR